MKAAPAISKKSTDEHEGDGLGLFRAVLVFSPFLVLFWAWFIYNLCLFIGDWEIWR